MLCGLCTVDDINDYDLHGFCKYILQKPEDANYSALRGFHAGL